MAFVEGVEVTAFFSELACAVVSLQKQRRAVRTVMFEQIDLKILSAITALANEGSFVRAAKRIGSTPSLLESQVVALEEELGLLLFVRNAEHVEPTPGGRVFLEAAQAYLRGR